MTDKNVWKWCVTKCKSLSCLSYQDNKKWYFIIFPEKKIVLFFTGLIMNYEYLCVCYYFCIMYSIDTSRSYINLSLEQNKLKSTS